ncbi:esterase/lipase family protein [Nocardioides dongkuii]|uniref:esterase/lipase family protein n=1 Tax=Nocardioides dongkuii TaxID=2760089 RepID=UPI0015FAA89C|nr:alpha/beta fold hydrolase [Nocardioides dongkuii]
MTTRLGTSRPRSLRLALALAVVLAMGAALLPSAPARADEKLPVPYSFLPGAFVGAVQVGSSAPGTNDWSCKPTKRHPRPVVLVHGLLGSRSSNWPTYGPLLHNKGYCVYALTYGNKRLPEKYRAFGGLDRMQSSARELKAFVAKVLRRTGAKEVDMVGHSEGTVVPAYYFKFLGGAKHVKRFVGLGGAYAGTDVAVLSTVAEAGGPLGITPVLVAALKPYFAAGPQLLSSSAFIRRLNSGGSAKVKGVAYTNVITRYDELVWPSTSGTLPGTHNVLLQDVCALDFSDHLQIVSSPIVARIVLNTLDPQHRRPVPCHLVTPLG